MAEPVDADYSWPTEDTTAGGNLQCSKILLQEGENRSKLASNGYKVHCAMTLQRKICVARAFRSNLWGLVAPHSTSSARPHCCDAKRREMGRARLEQLGSPNDDLCEP